MDTEQSESVRVVASATPTPTPPVYVSPEEILATFKANPACGKVQFMNQPVYVNGRIRGFNNSASRVVYLTSGGGGTDFTVFLVRFATLEEVAVLSIGDEIRLHCDLGIGEPFLEGKEMECTPVGPVSTGRLQQQPTATPLPMAAIASPTLNPTGGPSPEATATSEAAAEPAPTPDAAALGRMQSELQTLNSRLQLSLSTGDLQSACPLTAEFRSWEERYREVSPGIVGTADTVAASLKQFC